MTNQGGVQAAIRASTGTTLDYNGDWHALFTQAGISSGMWNERLLRWINQQMSASYASLPQAMQAYALNAGFNNWPSMNTLSLSPGGATDVILRAGSTTSGILRAGGANGYITRAS